MGEIMLAWVLRGPVYHIAAGKGWTTACGCQIRAGGERPWITATEPPGGRTICRRCLRMSADVSGDRERG